MDYRFLSPSSIVVSVSSFKKFYVTTSYKIAFRLKTERRRPNIQYIVSLIYLYYNKMAKNQRTLMYF